MRKLDHARRQQNALVDHREQRLERANDVEAGLDRDTVAAHGAIAAAKRRLDPTAEHAEEAHIATLIRGMGQALDARPVFRRPGEEELSFDEAWLMATISARVNGDTDSFAFLVGRRVAPSKRRTFAMLVSGLAGLLTSSRGRTGRETPAAAPSQSRLPREVPRQIRVLETMKEPER